MTTSTARLARFSLIAALLPPLLWSCSAGPKPASTEEARSRLLQYQHIKRHQRLFYVGISAGATLESTTDQAFLDISRQLTWLPSGDDRLRAQLRGLYRVDRTATDTSGTIHVLAVLERDAASAMLKKLAREERSKLAQTLARCEAQLKAGEAEKARASMNQGKLQVQRVQALLAAARAAVGDQARPTPFPEQDDAAKLDAKLSGVDTRSRSVMVVVLSYTDGRQTGELNADFRQVASARGLRVVSGSATGKQVDDAVSGVTQILADVGKNAGAGYVVAGKVSARFSSEDSGQFFAWASGRVRVIETTSGKSVAEISFDKIKGGHISRAQAIGKAISNVVARMKDRLGQALGKL